VVFSDYLGSASGRNRISGLADGRAEQSAISGQLFTKVGEGVFCQ